MNLQSTIERYTYQLWSVNSNYYIPLQEQHKNHTATHAAHMHANNYESKFRQCFILFYRIKIY